MDRFTRAKLDAEARIVKQFVTNVPLPSKTWCESAFGWNNNVGDEDGQKLRASFGDSQYAAFAEMWTSAFSEDVVSRLKYQVGDVNLRHAFSYAINRIMRKLVHDNPTCVRDKKVTFRQNEEIIDASIVLCLLNKSHVITVWDRR